jgi:hypothetical protein
MKRIVSIALFAALVAACQPKVTLGPGVKVTRKKVCNGYKNCGVRGTLMNVDGDYPVLIGFDDTGEAKVSHYLGQRWRGTYRTPSLCGSPLDKPIVAQSRLGQPYESEIEYTAEAKKNLKVGLKAALKTKLPVADADLNAKLDASVDRTVEEVIHGTYKVIVQPYGLANDQEMARRTACQTVPGDPSIITSLAVLTAGGETQLELRKRLLATLSATADANAKFKEALVNANVDLTVSTDKTVEEIIKTAVANTALVVVFGLEDL